MSHIDVGGDGALKQTRMVRIDEEFIEIEGLVHRLMTMVAGTGVVLFQ